MAGLDVARIVNVQVNMAPKATPGRNFGMLCILGSSGVIPPSERLRTYNNMTDVGEDFGVTDPEYIAAQYWFAQRPQPSQLAISGIQTTTTFSSITGSAIVFNVGDWTGITDGGFSVSINGTVENFGGMNFSSVTNVNDVVTLINGIINVSNLTLSITGSNFVIQSTSQGAVELSYLSAPTVGTDISSLLGMTQGQNGTITIGQLSETPLQAVQDLMKYQWYGLAFAVPSNLISQADSLTIAGMIEAASPSRMLGLTTQQPEVLDATSTSDLAYAAKQLMLQKTTVVYSSSSPYAVISYLARIFTTDFTANNTMITMKFKQLPLVAPENLNSSQADAVAAKNCNVFVQYNNDTAIVQEGVMSNGFFTDEVYGLDWLQNAVQTAYYNVLYSARKVPQTNAGLSLFTVAVTQVLNQAVNNGLIGAGVWNAETIAGLINGTFMTNGYYVFMPDIFTQSQADRDARIAPTMIIAVKLQGAIHFGNVIINVNR